MTRGRKLVAWLTIACGAFVAVVFIPACWKRAVLEWRLAELVELTGPVNVADNTFECSDDDRFIELAFRFESREDIAFLVDKVLHASGRKRIAAGIVLNTIWGNLAFRRDAIQAAVLERIDALAALQIDDAPVEKEIVRQVMSHRNSDRRMMNVDPDVVE